MRRFWLVLGLLAGCGRLVEESPELWPPPAIGTSVERGDPGSFDPCPQIAVEPARQLSFSAEGTSDPRVAWNEDLRQFIVVWREGEELLWRRLAEDGVPIGLQRVLRTNDTEHAVVPVTSDPTMLVVPGLEAAPFFVTVQTDHVIAVDRILDDDRRQEGELLAGALPTDALSREERLPVLASDGDRIALGYRTDGGDTALVSLRLLSTGEADCLHQEVDTDNPDAILCRDSVTVVPGVAAIGWLPPPPPEFDGTGEEEPAAPTIPSWWMAYRNQTSLRWVTLNPVAGSDTLHAEYPSSFSLGTSDFLSGPRIASSTRRLAVVVRRDDEAPVTQAWQLTDDQADERMLACVVSTRELSAGTPAVAWAHGRRLAVVGLTKRASDDTDVVIARADAPFTELDREAAIGRECPAPLDLTEVTTGVRARDPDVTFSGDALGVVWAQEDEVTEVPDVWFARARCVAP